MSRSGFSPTQDPDLQHSCHVQTPRMVLVSLPGSTPFYSLMNRSTLDALPTFSSRFFRQSHRPELRQGIGSRLPD